MARDIAHDIEQAVAPLAEAHGLELVAVEVLGRGGRPIVRVFLDREGGIDLDTIAAANPWVSDAIESTGAIPGPFVLEVSSPGVERPLRAARDWQRFTGRKATAVMDAPIDGVRTFTGVIVGVEADSVVLDVEGAHVALPFTHIRKAHLAFDFSSLESKESR